MTRFAEAEIARRALRRGCCASRTCRSSCSAGSAGRREDYQAWSDRLLAEQVAFVVPTSHEGETVTRFAIVNPSTTEDDITAILDTMA